MDMDSSVVRFAIALFIGALIGLERERSKSGESGHSGIGGIRTFSLFAVTGAVSAWLTMATGMQWIFLVVCVCVTALVISGGTIYAMQHPESHGLTTEIAAVVTFLLGGTVLFGHAELAVALAIVTSALLAYKQPLHKMIGKLDEDDLHAALKLLIASFIVLPVLPNRTIDPWDALNPYKIWLLVIVISSLSLVGYVVARWFGERRALTITGFFGGLVSSTAVTLAFAKRSREKDTGPADTNAMASGLMVAWAIMFARVLVIVALVNASLIKALSPAIIAMGMLALLFALIFYRGVQTLDSSNDAVPLRNPFSLTAAVPFALFFAFILLVVKIIERFMHGEGLNIVAILAGLTDVDAITLSMSELGRDPARMDAAVLGIVVASLSNTFFKCGIVLTLGSRGLKGRTVAATLGIFAAGAAAVYFF